MKPDYNDQPVAWDVNKYYYFRRLGDNEGPWTSCLLFDKENLKIISVSSKINETGLWIDISALSIIYVLKFI